MPKFRRKRGCNEATSKHNRATKHWYMSPQSPNTYVDNRSTQHSARKVDSANECVIQVGRAREDRMIDVVRQIHTVRLLKKLDFTMETLDQPGICTAMIPHVKPLIKCIAIQTTQPYGGSTAGSKSMTGCPGVRGIATSVPSSFVSISAITGWQTSAFR